MQEEKEACMPYFSRLIILRCEMKDREGRRIDVLSFMTVVVGGEKKNVGRWCQGGGAASI